MRSGRLGLRHSAVALLGMALLGVVPPGVTQSGIAVAQTEPGGHLGHHPGSPAPEAPASGAAPMPSPSGAPAGAGCGGMMGCMGGGPRPFYASLLDMPALTPEARQFIEAEAEQRIGWGSEAINAGHARLQRALAANDPVAVRQATEAVREGLARLESGTAALHAIGAGTPPRQFALAWFRSQLAVPAAETPMAVGEGPWGLSWYHTITMAFLAAFLLATLLIQYARMRRISGLVERLNPAALGTETGAKPPSPPAPAPGSTPAPAPNSAADAPGAPPVSKRPWSGMLRVAAIFVETPNVKTFRLEEPEGGDIPFTFLPGQFLTFSAEIDGKPVRRSYTIASAPTQRGYVEIAVKREEAGLESRYLHDQVAIGDLLLVSGPAGAFTFTDKDADSIVLIAGGIGITPMMSVIRCLNDRSYPGDIFFLYGMRTAEDFVFREELEYLQKRHANLHVAATLSDASDTAWSGSLGPISKQFIARAVPEIARRRVHLCGPPGMMEAVKTMLLDLGVASDKIRTEAFGPAQGRAPVGPEPAPVGPTTVGPGPVEGPSPPGSESAQAAGAAPPAAALPTATASVEFTTSGKTAPLAPDQTVLEAAEAIGVAIDFSCRVGTCGTCVVPLKAGTVTMEVEDGLPPEEKARGMILACQAKSVGNLVVEA